MKNDEITALVETIEALEPQTKEIVLQFVDLLLQAKKAGRA